MTARARTTQIRCVFDANVSMDEAEGTLHLAELAAASLHGPQQMELESPASIDHPTRLITIDITSAVGRSVALVFLGYERREFGDRIQVLRMKAPAKVGVGGDHVLA